jgi:hypothetical protein
MAFPLERNRLPPRLWPVFALRLGFRGRGVRRFAPDRLPFLDLPDKPGRASPGAKLEWPQAGRRQGDRSKADQLGGDEVSEPRSEQSRRREGKAGRAGERRVVGAAAGVAGSGRRWGSSGLVSRLGVWVVMARLSAAAGCRVCAAARARVRRPSLPGRRRARPGSRAAARARLPLLTPRRRTCSLAMVFRAGGRFATCGPL